MTQLLDWVEEHEVAFTYDWRTRFNMSLRAIGTADLTWREAWALTLALLEDPSSRVAVAVGKWDRPWSIEAAALADLWDLLVRINTDKSKQSSAPSYPRPVKAKPKVASDARADAAWAAHKRRMGYTTGIAAHALPAAPLSLELNAGPDRGAEPGEVIVG